ncbi:MAG: circadian clock protein KaiC [Thermoanaerobaculia bacterium]
MKSKTRERTSRTPRRTRALTKASTGIRGLDELTGGGLPRGRPTLLCGTAGCGKTLLAMEFIVHGALESGEPGVFMAFEENATELATNFASLGYDLDALIARKLLVIDFVHIDRTETEEAGAYDLEGLFIRLGHAIDSIGAKRVVLDTIETLFSGLSNIEILRDELRRLFRWLKTKGVTAVVTGERGETSLTRFGLEEYVADCVILLDHRVDGQLATRRLRIVKYRGSSHGTDEYPFLIDDGGISITPVSASGLQYKVSAGRVSSGVPDLDAMMEGEGYYRGSSVLLSGTAGTGKTSLAAHFAFATAARRERCLWIAFEESSSQITRNMRSIGIDLEPAVRQGFLRFHPVRPTICGLETHLARIHGLVEQFGPRVVIIDPVTNLSAVGRDAEVKTMLTRLIDYFMAQGITALFTSLTPGGTPLEATEVGVSSLMDTWLLLREVQNGAERNRFLHLVKSRGMAHSNQMREFLLTDRGVQLRDVYVGPSGLLLAGGARASLEAVEKAQTVVRGQEAELKVRQLERKRQAMEAQIAVLRAEFDLEESESAKTIGQDEVRARILAADNLRLNRLRRKPNVSAAATTPKPKRGGSP